MIEFQTYITKYRVRMPKHSPMALWLALAALLAGQSVVCASGFAFSTKTQLTAALNICRAADGYSGVHCCADDEDGTGLAASADGACPAGSTHISRWDVSRVEDMSELFKDDSSFNADISSWDVSSVKDMKAMFQSASSFDADISTWNVSSVEVMASMFSFTNSFNRDLSCWDVSAVTGMDFMFFHAFGYDQDLLCGLWTQSRATKSFMFSNNVNGGIAAEWCPVSRCPVSCEAPYKACEANEYYDLENKVCVPMDLENLRRLYNKLLVRRSC